MYRAKKIEQRHREMWPDGERRYLFLEFLKKLNK